MVVSCPKQFRLVRVGVEAKRARNARVGIGFFAFLAFLAHFASTPAENVGQDAILSHVFSSFQGEFCELGNDSSVASRWNNFVLTRGFSFSGDRRRLASDDNDRAVV